MSEADDLDGRVRVADPDRWLSARFVRDRAARDALIALYALHDEVARVGEAVTNPLAGEIRLAWWREGLDALFEGEGARRHPVLQALAAPASEGRLDRALLETLIEARHADLEPEPFTDEPALEAFIDGTAGVLMAAAARLLDPGAERSMVVGAARAWGWAGLMRATPAWQARGRRWFPASWGEVEPADLARHVEHRVEAALKAASNELLVLPVPAFPAVAYAALARPYAHGRMPTDVEKQVRLVIAVTRGRV